MRASILVLCKLLQNCWASVGVPMRRRTRSGLKSLHFCSFLWESRICEVNKHAIHLSSRVVQPGLAAYLVLWAHATAKKQVWHTFCLPRTCMRHTTASFMFWFNSFQGNFFKGTYISWEPTASCWSSVGLRHLWMFYPIVLEVFASGTKLMPGTMPSVLLRSQIWSVHLKSSWYFQNIHHFKGQKYVSNRYFPVIPQSFNALV